MNENAWIYDHSEPKARYALGRKGIRPFVCFGVNPSTATPARLDPTVASVARFTEDHGYDGWLMLNLYPQRATNPDKMHKKDSTGTSSRKSTLDSVLFARIQSADTGSCMVCLGKLN